MLLGFRGFGSKANGNGLIKRFGRNIWTYFHRIGSDYLNTLRDTARQVQEKPIKASAILSAVGFATAVYASCPHDFDYQGALLSASIDLWETPECLQNRRSLTHVEERIRALVCPYNYASSGPADGTKHVFSTRIVDVGAIGRFWALDSAMLDYDINEEEFSECSSDGTQSSSF
ncbi:unnamed protein product [Mesocestoides corti]|uniref:Uncharacterized protein n=1 Tax=Mesocestoides corti TaxID=53468 RepID=A0A0R3U163_MESCO|nr:unnamed protein product [Mesocestoides corti]